MNTTHFKRLKELAAENSRLKRIFAFHENLQRSISWISCSLKESNLF
jgi:uncharacterized protein YdcH (DUF465 family)